jgi:hypothetical protein
MKDFVQVKGSYRKNPMGPAAVFLYVAYKVTREYKWQTDISYKLDVTTTTYL